MDAVWVDDLRRQDLRLAGPAHGQGCDGRGRRDREDESNGAGQRSHDLLGHGFGLQEVEDRALVEEQQQEYRERGTGIREHDRVDGRRDVVATDPHPGSEQGSSRQVRCRRAQLPHGRRLGDGHVVQDAESRDDDRRGEQVPRAHRLVESRQGCTFVVRDATQPREVNREDPEEGSDADAEERSREGRARPGRQPVRQVEDDEHDGRRADERDPDAGLPLEEGRQHERDDDEPAETEPDEREDAAQPGDEGDDQDEQRQEQGEGRAALDLEE